MTYCRIHTFSETKKCDEIWFNFCWTLEQAQDTKTTSNCRNLPGFGHSVSHLSFGPQTLCLFHYHRRPLACSFGHQTVIKEKDKYTDNNDNKNNSWSVTETEWVGAFRTSSINLAWPCWSMGLMAFCSKPTEPGYNILLPNEWAIRKLKRIKETSCLWSICSTNTLCFPGKFRMNWCKIIQKPAFTLWCGMVECAQSWWNCLLLLLTWALVLAEKHQPWIVSCYKEFQMFTVEKDKTHIHIQRQHWSNVIHSALNTCIYNELTLMGVEINWTRDHFK